MILFLFILDITLDTNLVWDREVVGDISSDPVMNPVRRTLE